MDVGKALSLSCSFFFNIIVFIQCWLCWVFVAAQAFSLVAASGGYSPFAVHGLLIAVGSLDAKHGL